MCSPKILLSHVQTLSKTYIREIRKVPREEDLSVENPTLTNQLANPFSRYPAWIKIKRKPRGRPTSPSKGNVIDIDRDSFREMLNDQSLKKEISEKIRNAEHNVNGFEYQIKGSQWVASYHFAPWEPNRAHRSLLPFQINEDRPFIRSPDRKAGLADINRNTSRIKSFGLEQAILYSYLKDTRFVLAFSLILGITVWWYTTPEPLLRNPKTLLLSPDPDLLVKVVRDTFIDGVCSKHRLPSPCECGEPLNSIAKEILPKPLEFDPLDLKNREMLKGLSFLVASIVLSIALSESVSKYGVLEPLI